MQYQALIRSGRAVAVVLLVWLPFWLAYSYLVLTAVRQLDGSEADPLAHPLPALAYGALAMGLALLFALSIWWRIQAGWFHSSGVVNNLLVEIGHALLFTAAWVISVELIVVPLFYAESPFPLLDALARTPYRSARIFNGLFLYTAASGMAHAYRFFRESRAAAVRAEQAERLAIESRLLSLRAQLHPHFLFNALNAISELLHQDAVAADDALHRLSKLLRSFLEEDRESHPLADELALIRDHLALERIRFGDRLLYEEDVVDAHHALLVPSFAIHALVENCVRHAVDPSRRPVHVHLRTRRAGSGPLVISVTDDGAPEVPRVGGTGLGLKNLRARLKATHGDDATLVTTASETGFQAVLSLPARGRTHG